MVLQMPFPPTNVHLFLGDAEPFPGQMGGVKSFQLVSLILTNLTNQTGSVNEYGFSLKFQTEVTVDIFPLNIC